MAADDDLTQRERRAQRHRQTRRKDMPSNVKRNLRAYAPVLLIGLAVVGAAAGVIYLSSLRQDCVDGHWHATFVGFIPDEQGNPERIDFVTPRTPNGLHYYDLGSVGQGGDSYFSMTLHMHQVGDETGSAVLGPSQWHMEQAGKCVSVERGLHFLEIEASEDSLELVGAHEQVPGQSGTFAANETAHLHWWVQTHDACGVWGWHERDWSDVNGYQLQDGESLLAYLGDYNETVVKGLQAQVPPPMSRPAEECPATETSTAAVPNNGTAPDGTNATSAPPG